jgi:tetratricopeptide (TPR) repeat protein
VEGTRRLRGPGHPDVLTATNNLAEICFLRGRLADAEQLFREVLKARIEGEGPTHPHTLGAKDELAVVYQRQGKLVEAERLLVEVLQARRDALPPDHPNTLSAMSYLAECQQALGKLDQAESLFGEALEGRRRALGAEHPVTLGNMEALGAIRCLRKRFVEAEPVLRECLEIRKKTMPDDWSLFNIESLLGGSLLGQGKFAEAQALLRRGYEGMKARAKSIPPQGATRVPEALDRLIELYAATNRPDEAKKWQAERAKYPRDATPRAG